MAKGTLLAVFDVDGYPDYRPGSYFWVELPDRGHETRRGSGATSRSSPRRPSRRRRPRHAPARHGLQAHARGARAGRRGRGGGAEGLVPAARGRVAAVCLRRRRHRHHRVPLDAALHRRHGAPYEVTLLYSNRDRDSAAFLDELGELEAQIAGLRVVLTMTDDDGWEGEHRRIDEGFLRDHVGDLSRPSFFVAGRPRWPRACRSCSTRAGVHGGPRARWPVRRLLAATVRTPESFERQLGDRVTKRLKRWKSQLPARGRRSDDGDEDRTAEGPARRADRRARRRLGRAAAGPRADRGAVARRALRRPRARRQGRSRPAEPHAPGARRVDPPRLPRGRRRHDDDEHVHGDLDRPGRLRARARRARDEPRGRAHRPARRRRARRLRRGLGRAAERHALALAEGRRPRLPAGRPSTPSSRPTPSRCGRSRRAASTCS